jgi:hypothetical protein
VATRNKASRTLTARARVYDRPDTEATAVAEAIHVAPVRVVMKYAVCGTVVLALAEVAVLWAARVLYVEPSVAICAIIVLAVPWRGMVGRLLPGVLQRLSGK